MPETLLETDEIGLFIHGLKGTAKQLRDFWANSGGTGLHISAATLLDEAAERLASLQPSVSEMRCKRCDARDRHAKLADAYYRATNCPCTAAERYVEWCPKHGVSPALSPEGEP